MDGEEEGTKADSKDQALLLHPAKSAYRRKEEREREERDRDRHKERERKRRRGRERGRVVGRGEGEREREEGGREGRREHKLSLR